MDPRAVSAPPEASIVTRAGRVVTRAGRGIGRAVLGRAGFVGACVALAAVVLLLQPAAHAEDDAPSWTLHGNGLEVQGISSLCIHPKRPGQLVAYVHGMGPAVSGDGGKTWAAQKKGIEETIGAQSVVRITYDPGDAEQWYCVVDGHIYSSQDGAKSWKKISSQTHKSYSWDQKLVKDLCYEVRVDPKKSVRLAVGTRFHPLYNGGLYMSSTQGKEWNLIAGSKNAKSGLASTCRWVRLDPRTDKNILVAGERGVWSSDDRGVSFEPLMPEQDHVPEVRGITHLLDGAKELYLAEASGIWMNKGMGKKWGKKPVLAGDAVGVYVDSSNRKRVYAILRDRGLFVSENARRGKWEQLGGEGGYAAAEGREILSDPREKKHLYMTSPVTGLHTSVDRGATWTRVEANLPKIMPNIEVVAMHPAGATGGNAVLAIEENGMVFACGAEAPYTWQRIGRVGMRVRALVPVAGKAGHWLATGPRLMKSEDGGATWSVLLQPENPGEQISDVEIGSNGSIYALLMHAGEVHRTDDGGENWEKIKAPKKKSKTAPAVDLALNNKNPEHMLIATRNSSLPWRPTDLDGGVWETWDGGKKWETLNEDGLAPGRKERGRARLQKYGWNFARHVYVDCVRSLLVYCADGGGLYVRPLADPKGDKPDVEPAWYRVPNEVVPQGSFSALLRTQDGGYTAQLVGMDDSSALLTISGDALKAALDHAMASAAAKKKEDVGEAPETWKPLALPEREGGVAFSALAVDPSKADRLMGYDSRSGQGIFIWEVPAAAPTDENEKD